MHWLTGCEKTMYDIYFWATTNGHKILLLAEDASLLSPIKPINISKREQSEPPPLRVSPATEWLVPAFGRMSRGVKRPPPSRRGLLSWAKRKLLCRFMKCFNGYRDSPPISSHSQFRINRPALSSRRSTR
jgi:hypothetical protein